MEIEAVEMDQVEGTGGYGLLKVVAVFVSGCAFNQFAGGA